ncbi:adenylate/guanylate cyclase domain-containing protein [Treponema sp.]|uniref:adenylate/guanylate cyclase domain-containing protein n=1 Tax=Treponema sp. TaxID=166 RepID=UPI00298E3B25|nr:adenylate/guanylate cyclase domain-containing protein [Treponema sp.]MCR5613306.1 adenylate/guanylate cyclase domain-containing protein [Treponema sp.]
MKSGSGKKHLKFNFKFILKKINLKKILFFVCRLIPAAILLTLFILPMGMKSLDLSLAGNEISLIAPYLLPFMPEKIIQGTIFHYIYFLIYFLPFTVLFLLISLFIKEKLDTILYIVTYVALSIYLFCSISCLIIFANCVRWFSQVPLSIYLTFAFAFIAHAVMSIFGIKAIRKKNAEFAEYKKFQAESKEKTKLSIKTKLIFTIISAIAVILLVFTFLILTSYKTMFVEAVSDVGRSQAEQTANIYDSADGKYEKISVYFAQQKEANSYADCPFERIDIITAKQTSNIIFKINGDKISLGTDEEGNPIKADDIKWPTYDIFSYTTAIGKVKNIPDEEKTIMPEDAKNYFVRFQNGNYKKQPVYYNEFCKYIYPVSFTRKDGNKLVGFSIVTYRKDILMRSYFHVQIFVYTMIVMFIYIAIFVSMIIADFITNPLLYLKTNVRKTTNILEEILSGNSKITANQLTFEDTIRTSDETKDLSIEIKNMVNIIRGIIPYISFSTLQAAEKETKKASVSRELCFLFTDIRGFTSLCEGKQPREVVDILNHYLDIETEIILKNGGDIDKFVGDEMMAFFAGPKKEYNACKAAMEIRAAMREQQQQALKDGSDYISMGIGINTGKVVFGSVGARTRMDFTSIGDTVNLAARLEGANKAYGSKSIITESVYEKLKGSFVCRELDFIKVKGKTKPVCIYEILQEKATASEKLFEIKTLFEKGLESYRKQNWALAEKMFTECSTKYNDMPSVVFLDRIAHFKTNPPPKKWDGVFELKVK